ncbi:hypothetical protein AQUCO_01600220v1 [Aquilegia coerulea]|uniref:Peptidase S59 domain-containing protein n=1 Tax=Aquilegia coerulea TaxID=218851 RepID=A0A2G5DQX2_AQUCA|nr:hypothetical protein AQUCO_01600220v1 [Aquilegia coerulea]
MRSKMLSVTTLEGEFGMVIPDNIWAQSKKRKISADMGTSLNCFYSEFSLPTLNSYDYFMEPSVKELIAWEHTDPGHCSRVNDFTVGRIGYGQVKFLGQTDVRLLNIDQIVKFDRHEIVVYENEKDKPVAGEGLNKASIVTLILKVRSECLKGKVLNGFVKKLKSATERQGAHFISFNPLNGEWIFLVNHFSRFGLTEDDEDDIMMDDAAMLQHPGEMDDSGVPEADDQDLVHPVGTLLSHSLPAHLGLDPLKMQEMRMLMFPAEEAEEFDGPFSQEQQSFRKESARPSLHYSALNMNHKNSPPAVRRTPLALLGYNASNSDPSPPGTILMTSQNKGMPLKISKVEGFKLDLKCETPIRGNHSNNVVDAALFMGRSFRVGWGPNGILVHTGTPVAKTDSSMGYSSIITMEKVALDNVVRDENNNVKEDLVDLCFISPLELHKSMSHETTKVEVGPFRLKLQKLVSNRLTLAEICRNYVEIIERQLDVTGLPVAARTRLMHQVMVWELIKVLFSARDIGGHRKTSATDEEDIMHDKDSLPEIDLEALPLVRRAEFSYWLQESVCHRVQEEISCLNDSSELEHIFSLLTGRQLDAAVELAASRGDVRLGCLLSQAGGSMVNRSDVARQLDLWRINGLDFNFMEKDRLRLYELLAGNIQGSLGDTKLDWKRFLGLLMWYQLPPDTSLPEIIHSYEQLLLEGSAPYPVPVYIDEGPVEEEVNWSVGDRFDLAYYLMLLHADENTGSGVLKTMFSAFSSSHDALDYHMIWHQRAILEAIGTFSSNDLHVLDMSLVSQLLCLGLCHWAIYVVLQMPHRDDFPFLQTNLIREILFQYCEFWSTQETQRQFIEELGVPSAWMNEAMAVYCNYHGDLLKALEHFLESYNWQRAHTIFTTSVAHSLFLSAKHSEIWRLTTCMEENKAEIADWDLGAGIYVSFYLLRSLFLEENTVTELDSFESRTEACREFFGRLKESLDVWGSRLPVDARVSYSKMAEEICCLLQSNGEGSSSVVRLGSYDTMANAPLPEDLRSCHLQEAISHFTSFLSETAS